MAVEQHNPQLYFDHRPIGHATTTAWAVNLGSKNSFKVLNLAAHLTRQLYDSYNLDLPQYAVVYRHESGLLEMRVRGGRLKMHADQADEELVENFDEAASARGKPRQSGTSSNEPLTERCNEICTPAEEGPPSSGHSTARTT